jgi:hypothetical protein
MPVGRLVSDGSQIEQVSEASWRVYRQFKISHIKTPTLDTNSEHVSLSLQTVYSNITKEINGTAYDKQVLIG